MKEIMPSEGIERRIYLIRGHKVMLDGHLAELYGVPTKALSRAVTRNIDRFPRDFMFRLSHEEYRSLRCQIGTLKRGGHSKYLPRVFTEQGVAMLSSVLRSFRAIHVNIAIMRAFVNLRRRALTQRRIARKLRELESKVESHDTDIKSLFEAIRELVSSPDKPKPAIGFRPRGS